MGTRYRSSAQLVSGFARIAVDRIADPGVGGRLTRVDIEPRRLCAAGNDGDVSRRFVLVLRDPVDPDRAFPSAAGDNAIDCQGRIFRSFRTCLDVHLALAIEIH